MPEQQTAPPVQLAPPGRPVLLALLIGLLVFLFQVLTRTPYTDPLVLALLGGIGVRTLAGERWPWGNSLWLANRLFIPLGILFYALTNLNFGRIGGLEPRLILLLLGVMAVYFGSVLLLGRWLGQKPTITCLTATGSAICGASAIAITSAAVDADSDDIAIALLAVTLVAVLGLFVVLPFLAVLLQLAAETYALAAGAVLQLTGFVKVAMERMPFLAAHTDPASLRDLALSVKAGRYLGLLIAIPLFASWLQGRLILPRVLWVFLAGGLAGSWLCATQGALADQWLRPWIRPAYQLSWSIAMAAIGLNADVRKLLSDQGIRALGMAGGGFCAALLTFFLGFFLLH